MMEKQGAKQIIEKGVFPRTASALREVRGIGDYTAGAIASIAFTEVVHSLATRQISVCIFFSFFKRFCDFFYHYYRLSQLWMEMLYD
jgi:superfamily II RNA helicase